MNCKNKHRISKKLNDAIKLSNKNKKTIAHEVGIHPSIISRLLRDDFFIMFNDPRVLRIGKVLNIEEKDLFYKK